MKYEVLVNELQWHNVVYRVEAENEEEARDFNDFKIVEE